MFRFLFGCPHENYTFPQTVKRQPRGAARLTGTYVCCLECGYEMPYDWKTMSIVWNPKKYQRQQAATFADQIGD